MRKMNRSQSSYRNKTLLTQDDSQSFLNRYTKRHQLKGNHNASHSFVQAHTVIDTNKQNNSLYQSVSQRCLQKKQPKDHLIQQGDAGAWRERCYKYEEELNRLYREREENFKEREGLKQRQQRGNDRSYNYSEQYYSKEIQQLRGMLRQRDRIIQQLRQQSSARCDDLEQISSQMGSRIEKDTRDKNTLVKEINNKQIQINNLQERVQYHRAQIDTLKLYIQQKDSSIRQLEEKIGQVDMRKKKIQHYQFQIKQHNETLKELQAFTLRLKEGAQLKDTVINQKCTIIHQLQTTIDSYEDKLHSIQQSLLILSQERKELREKSEERARECEEWKRNYEQLLGKSRQAMEFELQMKAYMKMSNELSIANAQLTRSHQQHKITIATLQKTIAKHTELDKDLSALKKELKDKEQKLSELQMKERSYKHMEDNYSKLRKEKEEVWVKLQQKIKQQKTLHMTHQELKAQTRLLQDELAEMQQNNNRVKERGDKIDTVMRQNTRLNGLLIDKINQIQKLQLKINKLQATSSNQTHQISRLRTEAQQLTQEIREQNLQIDNIRERYQLQTNNRIVAEDKLVRNSQEISALRFSLTKMQEENDKMAITYQAQTNKHQNEVNQFRMIIVSQVESQKESGKLLQDSKKHINEIQTEMEEVKKGMEESIKKEKEHRTSLAKLQLKLVQVMQEKERLQSRSRQTAHNAEMIKGLAETILKLQTH